MVVVLRLLVLLTELGYVVVSPVIPKPEHVVGYLQALLPGAHHFQ